MSCHASVHTLYVLPLATTGVSVIIKIVHVLTEDALKGYKSEFTLRTVQW